ncbi:MAG: CDP-alcohol phosphatidyltransferase family protein [Cytophagales bacterium]|nr:CDP-alcohol phosphatidyltransferase family protein [Cytophagales bacterium]
MLKHLPNFLTLCNLACGCFGTVAVLRGDPTTGSIMIWSGAILDFFDGFAARMLNKFSIIGRDLDSLADLITFCFLPGSILYVLMLQSHELNRLAYSGYFLVIFGALRLAKFNNDARQSENFYGLPVPASAIFVSAFPFIENEIFSVMHTPAVFIGVAVLLSVLMVSNLKLMSLKFSGFSFKHNRNRYLLIISSLVLLAFLHYLAIPIIIISYVVFSIALNIAE